MTAIDTKSIFPYSSLGTLEKHIQRKFENEKWISPCLGGNPKAFPFRVIESGRAKIIHSTLCYPTLQNTKKPAESESMSANFVVNIPDGSMPSSKRYTAMLAKMQDESFFTDAPRSREAFISRVAVVIGANRPESLDRELNRRFVKSVESIALKTDVICRIFGFLWRPTYEVLAEEGRNSSMLHSEQKSFFLLKLLNPAAAEDVRKLVEEDENKRHPNLISQIPFTLVRQTILKSDLTRTCIEDFSENALAAPVYLTVMDADFISLRLGQGVFSKVTEAIVRKPSLTVIGCGYGVEEPERPLIRLAVRIDMAVRAAMTSVIPYSAYLPEPFLAVLVRKAMQSGDNVKDLSFLGKGRSLESRRLIQNGRSRGVLNDSMEFIPDGVVTTSPERWTTEKTEKYTILTKKDVQRKRVLQSLRGLSQSHIHTKKWADQVYAAIEFTCNPVTDATEPMMEIFGVYDPIARMFATLGRYSVNTFRNAIREYDAPLTKAQLKILKEAKAKLRALKMPDPLIEQIVEAAKCSGRAIKTELVIATA